MLHIPALITLYLSRIALDPTVGGAQLRQAFVDHTEKLLIIPETRTSDDTWGTRVRPYLITFFVS